MEPLRRLVQELALAGYQLDRSAFDYLREMDESQATAFAKNLLLTVGEKTNTSHILSKQRLLEISNPTRLETTQVYSSVAPTVPAKKIPGKLEILRDPCQESGTGGTIEDFSHYFQDRFKKLTSAFRERPDSRDAGTLGQALTKEPNQKVKFLGMVMEKRERKQKLFLQIDDLEDTATVLVSPEEHAAFETAQKIPLDQVICVSAVRAKGDLFVAKEILLPDIPDHKPHLANEEVWTVMLSDLHIGSKKFLSKELSRVFDWLNLKIGTANQRAIAERTKYVVICGDIVDGIGIYPRQEHELAITDLYEQYKEAAKYLGMIPDHIQAIILPGNHDPVRQALPQPHIPREFGEPLYEAREFTSLGNPCEVSLHGVRFLLHHGRSLDDILSSAPNMDFSQPEKAMRLQLQCRHIAPEYGNRTSIAPERQDHLFIDKVPDVFHSGHIHVVKYENYRGTQIVNSGAWQAQTDYQRRVGLVPTPGILTAINLNTAQVRLINFMEA
ncbi:MAG TPA: DNA-directed DNA polymerase II small subunit [Candidatus Acidoferrales bacterium]|nr:DNA-directed DNA polymerase II small subunit [Candidatus Acidoferrales bacterium]